jgi:hypothetical protein
MCSLEMPHMVSLQSNRNIQEQGQFHALHGISILYNVYYETCFFGPFMPLLLCQQFQEAPSILSAPEDCDCLQLYGKPPVVTYRHMMMSIVVTHLVASGNLARWKIARLSIK